MSNNNNFDLKCPDENITKIEEIKKDMIAIQEEVAALKLRIIILEDEIKKTKKEK